MLKRLAGRSKEKISDVQEVTEFAGGSERFVGTFKQKAEETTPEKVDKIASAERAAAKSQGQRSPRKRPRVRTEQWSGRMDPKTLVALEMIAEANGGKNANDGIHMLVDEAIEARRIKKKDLNERTAARIEKSKGRVKKNKGGGQ